MSLLNPWATFKNEPVSWYAELPAALWDGPEAIEFADRVLEAGRREGVYLVDHAPSTDRLFPSTGFSQARVSVRTAPDRIEERTVGDLRPELLALEPSLNPRNVPRAEPLTIWGPLSLDRDWPIYISVTPYTDLWFPYVVNVFDDSDEPFHLWDNRALANRHTPRLNNFIAETRERVLALGGTWEHEVSNPNYGPMTNDHGIDLDIVQDIVHVLEP
jgi:hypothetical protein